MTDTPRTDELREGIRKRNVLRGFNMPEDHHDALDLAADLERQAFCLAESLQAALNGMQQWRDRAEAEIAKRQEAERSLDHTRQWYAERMQWLEVWFRTTGKDLPIAVQFWNIIANGTPDVMTPPTYQQLLNMAKHRAEKAEADKQEAERERDQMKSELPFSSGLTAATQPIKTWLLHEPEGTLEVALAKDCRDLEAALADEIAKRQEAERERDELKQHLGIEELGYETLKRINESLLKDFAALSADKRALVEKAEAFLKRIDELTPAITRVIHLAGLHGVHWRPQDNWVAQREALNAALKGAE